MFSSDSRVQRNGVEEKHTPDGSRAQHPPSMALELMAASCMNGDGQGDQGPGRHEGRHTHRYGAQLADRSHGGRARHGGDDRTHSKCVAQSFVHHRVFHSKRWIELERPYCHIQQRRCCMNLHQPFISSPSWQNSQSWCHITANRIVHQHYWDVFRNAILFSYRLRTKIRIGVWSTTTLCAENERRQWRFAETICITCHVGRWLAMWRPANS